MIWFLQKMRYFASVIMLLIIQNNKTHDIRTAARCQDLVRGNTLGGRPFKGSRRIFENWQKNFLRQFFVWTKNKVQSVGIFLRNFEIFWWKFNIKIEFSTIFGKIVAKNRAFRNKINFLFVQYISISLGGGTFLCSPPGGAYAYTRIYLVGINF